MRMNAQIDDYVDITDHIRNGDMQPGPSQRWHFWCAAYSKKLVLHDCEEKYRHWTEEVTKSLGDELAFSPSSVAVINDADIFAGYEVNLTTHANLIFTTHQNVEADGLLLNDVIITGSHIQNGHDTPRKTFESLTRPDKEGDDEDDVDAIAALKDKDAIGEALFNAWMHASHSLAYRDPGDLEFLKQATSMDSAQIAEIFKSNRLEAARIAFFGANATLNDDLQAWLSQAPEETLLDIQERIKHDSGGTGDQILLQAYERETLHLTCATKVEYNRAHMASQPTRH